MSTKQLTIRQEFFKGFFKENPVFVLLLGMCPTLGVTTSAINGLGMGLATTMVLLGSNVVVSLVKNLIPEKVRIPAYIVIIASFVTIIDLTMAAYLPALHAQLGIFIPLIVVNCIILGRAEAFAGKNSLGRSVIDALGMGFGFAMALTMLGAVREILGSGAFFGLPIVGISENPILLFVMPSGAFLALGFLIAAVNTIRDRYEEAQEAKVTRKGVIAPDTYDAAYVKAQIAADKEKEKEKEQAAESDQGQKRDEMQDQKPDQQEEKA